MYAGTDQGRTQTARSGATIGHVSARDWLNRWRGRRLLGAPLPDLVLMLVFVVVALVWWWNEQAALPGALLATVPMAWRRRWPVLCFVIQLAGVFAMGEHADVPVVAALLVTVYATGASSRQPFLSLAVLLLGATLVTVVYPDTTPPIPTGLTPFALILPLWVFGFAIRASRQRADALAARAAHVERERETALRLAVDSERARIARELHDVVSHNVAVMVVQAGAARKVVTTEPGQAEDAMRAVESCGRAAMAELRHLLGLLARSVGDEPAGHTGVPEAADLTPQPGLSRLDELVSTVVGAGQPVTVRLEGSPRPLPPGVDLAAYRVVQEALTNALRHAPGAPTEVLIGFTDEAVRVEVLDDGVLSRPGTADVPAPGAGRGLLGLAERVALYGGALESGRRPAGGYRVAASFPVAAP
jgi:signal transduction histidine kinase